MTHRLALAALGLVAGLSFVLPHPAKPFSLDALAPKMRGVIDAARTAAEIAPAVAAA